MKYTMTAKKAESLMKSIARKEGVKLAFLSEDEGRGGYNYGGSSGNAIMLSPFVKGKAGEKVKGYEIYTDCPNPIECKLIAFFHELSHCVLSKKVPSHVKGYNWNDTSKYQYELWITMLGVEYAHSKYGLKFSDQSMKWLLDENGTYINSDPKRDTAGLVCVKATKNSYTTVSQWDFKGKPKKKGRK